MGQRLNPFGVLQVVHLVRQDLSIAGKRAGLAGARSGLFMEQVRIVKEMREADKRNGRTGDMVRPRYLVWENVVGAFSSNKGKDFAAVLEEIIKIVEPEAPGIEVPEKGWPTWGGYHDEMGGRWSVVWRTHDAQYWGVPQRRRRISVVADFGGDTASEIQFDGESVSGDIAESGASGEGFAEAAERGFNPAVARSLTARADGSPCADRGPNIVCSPHQGGGCDGGGKGALVQTEKSGTLGTGNDQTIFQSCITPWDCQSKRIFGTSGEAPTLQGGIGGGVNNPAIFCMATQQGGAELRTDDRAPTLTAAAGMSGNNQPVVAIPINDKEAVLCAGFKLGNSEQARSIGYQEELSPTLNAECGGNKPAVVAPAVALDMTHACDVIRECGEQVPALQARMGTGGNRVPLTYQDVTGTLSPGAHAGSYNGQDAYNDMLVCGASPDVAHALRAKSACAYREDAETYPVQNMVVRRLTPLECARLQGYPDGWVDIGDWTDEKGKKHKDADSPKYKALGNSIALPFWGWMLRRMARYLPEGATLGSLFDGISGFNVCWARIHGAEHCRWSSEIEQFPIAVTKKHFGDEKSGEKGDWDIFGGGMT
jgi:DNA (cytosine-5)-methyltransferase 1